MVCLDSFKKINEIDCANLLVTKDGYDKRMLEFIEKRSLDENWDSKTLEIQKMFCQKKYKVFKDEVISWLHQNVPDVKVKKHSRHYGWCVGSDDYQQLNSSSITVWFARKKDALSFIEKFSIYKKPTTYFDYFKDIRKELNLKTLILKKVEDYSEEIDEFAEE